MLINATEKRWFDAMDGTYRIGDIIEKTRPTSQKSTQFDMARIFFERLWWYDQVVFDASCPYGMPMSVAVENHWQPASNTRRRQLTKQASEISTQRKVNHNE